MSKTRKITILQSILLAIENHQDKKWCRNEWLHDAKMSIYVRYVQRFFGVKNERQACLDLASISVHKPGRGTFTAFLTKLEKKYSGVIYIENVLTPRFARFLDKRGYLRDPYSIGTVPSYYRPEINHGRCEPDEPDKPVH
jgi:hypothetical protein